jgi:NADPH-dependent glutamate synthase beta subunit-like oxidoreductase
MKLGFGLVFEDLSNLAGLTKLHHIFLNFLKIYDVSIPQNINISEKIHSEFLIRLAPFLDDFLSELFAIESEVHMSRLQHKEFDVIYECKRKFVQRYAIKTYTQRMIEQIDFDSITKNLIAILSELNPKIFAYQVILWQNDKEKYSYELDLAAQYAAYMVYNNNSHSLFNIPKLINQNNLIDPKIINLYEQNIKLDFDYYGSEHNLDNALNQSHYCIYCHNQGKDSCSKGLKTRSESAVNGCPLKQKISEMNYIKSKGFNIGALAIVVLDNPMMAATGHRVCNDCMKACIFQKQDPVNVPIIESNILEEILILPYGLEIYLLLTKWNPLNIISPLPKQSTNYNVLIAGLGPAGFSLAHYLLNEGHNVVAIDGLKISALSFDYKLPIKYWYEHTEALSIREPKGFGGVAEYGITSRWNKNYLTIIRLILQRRENFKIYGNVIFDQKLKKEEAFLLGFDHIALCIGSAAPKMIELNYNLSKLPKGIMSAFEFLKKLQAEGAFLKDTNSSLTIRLPVAIIGCGLTAIDAATEALRYYPMQIQKLLQLYENGSDIKHRNIDEFIEHAKLLRQKNDVKDVQRLLTDLGGITIYYHSNLSDSNAYKINHDEILRAMALGVKFEQNMIMTNVNIDKDNHVTSINFGQKIRDAKTILIAIGTKKHAIQPYDDRISCFGDNNPLFIGSVVKALASSKYNFAAISTVMSKKDPGFVGTYSELVKILDKLLH